MTESARIELPEDDYVEMAYEDMESDGSGTIQTVASLISQPLMMVAMSGALGGAGIPIAAGVNIAQNYATKVDQAKEAEKAEELNAQLEQEAAAKPESVGLRFRQPQQ